VSSAIVSYYEQTWADYRVVWLNRVNYALHFGYHDVPGMPHHLALTRHNEVMAERAAVGPGQHVLDAGCGVGGSACWLAAHRGARVTGVTLVADQVARARRIADERGVADRVQFEVADYARLPMADGTFDVVWAQESLCHAPDKAAAYREFFRVLKPGGRLVIAEYMRTTRRLGRMDARIVRAWVTGWAMPDLDTLDEHRGHATAAGFGPVALRDETPRVEPSLRRLFRRTASVYPLGMMLRATGLRSAVQHANVRASFLQYIALRRGAWRYVMLQATRPC
jgi:ubiquinone/menaquinone biosynthesis C-methylase UbiE